jgi:hypothetical protein
MTTDIVRRVLEGELVDEPAGRVRVLALLSPFTLDRRDFRVPAGQTLDDIVRGLQLPSWKDAMVAIDGRPVKPECWAYTRPHADHLVTIRAIPRGGGGDSSNKGWIQTLAGVVLIVVGILLAFTTWGAAFAPYVITAGIGLAISGILTLVMPPPQIPKLKDRSGTDQPVFSITGSRNTANPWGSVPRPFGRHHMFPGRRQ